MLLEVTGLSKRFGGLQAVDQASLVVEAGAIVGLVGPNGAGKTTLFAAISGFIVPELGRVVFDGTDITGWPAYRVGRAGMVRTFQITQPFAELNVRENIAVGAFARLKRPSAAREFAAEVARIVGMERQLDMKAGSLTVAGRKRLELARALATRPTLLLLDEVMAGLNPTEINEMIQCIRQIRSAGTTILMIEHVMQAVMALAERIYVLNTGRIIAEGTPQEIVSNQQVVEAYLGKGAATLLNGLDADA